MHLGLDFMLEGNTHRLKKIILRTNSLSHPLLLRYKACDFIIPHQVKGLGTGGGVLRRTDSFEVVRKVFGEPLGPGVIHDEEGNPFGASTFYAFHGGLLFEVDSIDSFFFFLFFIDMLF
jgi:hypothetical protein